ncbi:MAG: hypothetical protein E3K37_07200 [Candidatus Kuenenia sp.]|nr:hypothetical protein [Candidatus Kuenenia hertensis]
MKRYEKYKPSGVEWIGEIPEHWESKKLKYIANINPSKPPGQFANASDDEVVFLPMEKVSEEGKINQELRRRIDEVSSGFTSFERNDVIVAKITPCFENGKGAFLNDLETDFGYGSTEFHVLRANKSVSPKFLFYITKSHPFMKAGEAFMTGSAGQKRVPASFVENFVAGTPPEAEQTAIANYLDEKTAQIDTLIEKKQKLIELLKEERTAIINHAVTKGINPKAKLKPSGIEWLVDIPAHWEVKKLKYVTEVKYGLGQPPRQKTDGLPLIRATNVERGKIVDNDLIYIDPDDIPYDRDPVLKENDIIVVRSGAYTGDSAIIPKKYEGAITGYDMVVRVITADPIFISYCLLSNYVLINQLYLHRLRAAQPHLNKDELGEAFLLLPTFKEQQSIVWHIETETQKIDATVSKIEKEIELLQEYRTALISEVVTGKIKVV